MPSENHAVYLIDKHGKPLEVRTAPYTTPGPGELVIKNAAIAINPVDGGVQMAGNLMFPYLKYPAIMGSDVSGVVVEVGSAEGGQLPPFQPGDRVVGHAVGIDKRNSDDLSHERACVLPLGLSTAACGLFMKDYLALRRPTLEPKLNPEVEAQTSQDVFKGTSGEETRTDVVVVWGASTSVGSNAVQLACAAGYEVVATASPKNFEYVKSLGASRVLDYKQLDTVPRIIQGLHGKTCAGALAIGAGSLEACIDIVSAVPGRKFISQASNPIDISEMPTGTVGLIGLVLKLLWWNISTALKAKFKGVSTKFIWGSDVIVDEIGPVIYNDYLPQALASGQFQAKPEPRVVGTGLESVQEAINTCIKGISAAKVVVTL
ncbi:hypothetical protein KJ359_003730 [Pestalotiopsis sp. 9143b]|nr:hypothetical protein KJ359_003730 [Pestalotiopsis sp. 9143b]